MIPMIRPHSCCRSAPTPPMNSTRARQMMTMPATISRLLKSTPLEPCSSIWISSPWTTSAPRINRPPKQTHRAPIRATIKPARRPSRVTTPLRPVVSGSTQPLAVWAGAAQPGPGGGAPHSASGGAACAAQDGGASAGWAELGGAASSTGGPCSTLILPSRGDVPPDALLVDDRPAAVGTLDVEGVGAASALGLGGVSRDLGAARRERIDTGALGRILGAHRARLDEDRDHPRAGRDEYEHGG